MWPFKKQIALPAPIQRRPSTFATDWDMTINGYNKTQYLQEQAKKSFQVPMASFKPIGAMDSSFAMDAQYTDLTCAKIQNMSYNSIPEVQFAYFAGNGFIGWQTAAMLSQHWLINKACTMPAEDSARNGYEITVNDGTDIDPDILSYIRDKDKEFQVLPNCVEMVRMGRIFGIRIVLFLVESNDKEYYEKPFNPDSVKPGAYKGMSQIDPYWLAPMLNTAAAVDTANKDFYEPTWWLINGKRVHRSHLVIFKTCQLPDILKPTYIYGGIPVPQWISERVYAAERTANEAPMLALSKRLTTYKVDLSKAAANQEEFEAKLTYWTQTMNNFGVKIIGNDENEEIQQFDTSLADLDAVIMSQFQLVAAAAEVPATKLLGTTPKGFNSTGEYDSRSYHQKLTSIQQHGLSPLVERHHLLLIQSYVAPKFGIKPFNLDSNWNPVDEPTAAELADINLKKAQADSAYAQTGAIDGVDIRDKLIADKDSGFNGIQPISDPLNMQEEIESDDNDSAEES